MNRAQGLASRRRTILRECGLESLTPMDVTNDRLADVLRVLFDDERYRGRVSSSRQIRIFQVHVRRNQEAIERAMKMLGQRVSATNQQTADLGLTEAIEASRDAYLAERNVGQPKNYTLSLGPLDVQRDDYRVSLIRLLTIDLRVVTILDDVVRSALAKQNLEIARLCAGNPKHRTSQPTTEQVLEAFHEMTLTIVSGPGCVQRHLPPLSALQQRVVALCGFFLAVSTHLTGDSRCRPVIEANPFACRTKYEMTKTGVAVSSVQCIWLLTSVVVHVALNTGRGSDIGTKELAEDPDMICGGRHWRICLVPFGEFLIHDTEIGCTARQIHVCAKACTQETAGRLLHRRLVNRSLIVPFKHSIQTVVRTSPPREHACTCITSICLCSTSVS